MGVTEKVIDVGHRRQGRSPESMHFLGQQGLVVGAILAAVLLIAIPGSTWAQTASTGGLAGTVLDASGASVPGAEVKVTNEASGEIRTVTSGNNGGYSVPLLVPGSY